MTQINKGTQPRHTPVTLSQDDHSTSLDAVFYYDTTYLDLDEILYNSEYSKKSPQ